MEGLQRWAHVPAAEGLAGEASPAARLGAAAFQPRSCPLEPAGEPRLGPRCTALGLNATLLLSKCLAFGGEVCI